MDDFPAIVRQYDEYEQYFECRRRHDKEVDSDKVFQLQIEKRSPSSRGQSLPLRFESFHGRFRDLNPQLVKFGDYAWRAPGGIGSPHPFNELSQFWCDLWSARTAILTQRSAVVAELFFAKVRLSVAEQRRERRATGTRISPELTKLDDRAVQRVVVVPSTETLQADGAGQLFPAAVTALSKRSNCGTKTENGVCKSWI